MSPHDAGLALASLALHGWIAALVLAAACRALFTLVPDGSPRLRQALACGALVAAPALAVAIGSGALPRSPAIVRLVVPRAGEAGAAPLLAAGTEWLAAIWVIVALLLFGREAAGHFVLSRRRKSWRPVAPELREVHPALREGRFLTGKDGVPMTIGLFRPVTFLPETLLAREPAASIERIARHELSHARWLDPLTGAVTRLFRIALWPVAPLLWIERMIAAEMEAAADRAALTARDGAEERAEYAEQLLALAQSARGRLPPAAAALTEPALERRIRRILGASSRSVPRTLSAILVLMASTVAAAQLPAIRFELSVGSASRRPSPEAAGVRPERSVAAPDERQVRIVVPLRVRSVDRSVIRRE